MSDKEHEVAHGQPLPEPDSKELPITRAKRKKRKNTISKEMFAAVCERAARILQVEAVVVSSPLGTGLNRIFIVNGGNSRLLDDVPAMTSREAYAFLQGLAYPRTSSEAARLR